jgi:hypothetical protein
MGLPREHWPRIAGTTHRERVSREVRRRADAIAPRAFRRSSGRIAPDPGDDAIIRRAGARMRLETLARVTGTATVRLPAVAACAQAGHHRELALLNHRSGHGPRIGTEAGRSGVSRTEQRPLSQKHPEPVGSSRRRGSVGGTTKPW